ncbi:MAG: UPF0755 protein [Acidimicrobiales bacterium]|jgi:UPF0755 protein
MHEPTELPKNSNLKRKLSIFIPILLLGVLALGIFTRVQFNAPADFKGGVSFEVTKGMSVRTIADAAQAQGIVRSGTLLYSILTYSYDPTSIYAGTYMFDEPTSVFGVAQKLADKDIEQNLVKVTLPEGMRLAQIAAIAKNVLPEFDVDEYLIQTSELEGYLFPETYFVPETFTSKELVDLQRKTYEKNVAPLRDDIEELNFTEYEVLTLASIVEREANDKESMKMVAGILKNRLDINMALQADATIEYVLDTPLNELPAGQLASELRETQSPYNTYLNAGLTPTPIGNPGIMAIEAVVYSTPSDNFFYITAPDGTFYYAETYAEHNRNIARYLR